jgi:GPI ethanolamine phosphate transferase 3 subunit O
MTYNLILIRSSSFLTWFCWYAQLSSGFIGADRFDFKYAGTMLAINTFGAEVVVMAVVMVVVSMGAEYADRSGFTDKHRREENISSRAKAMSTPLLCMYTWCAYRMFLVACSCGCALIHRRHLMVWAVFAPKVAFETAFWGVTGVFGIILVVSMSAFC